MLVKYKYFLISFWYFVCLCFCEPSLTGVSQDEIEGFHIALTALSNIGHLEAFRTVL